MSLYERLVFVCPWLHSASTASYEPVRRSGQGGLTNRSRKEAEDEIIDTKSDVQSVDLISNTHTIPSPVALMNSGDLAEVVVRSRRRTSAFGRRLLSTLP